MDQILIKDEGDLFADYTSHQDYLLFVTRYAYFNEYCVDYEFFLALRIKIVWQQQISWLFQGSRISYGCLCLIIGIKHGAMGIFE
jgi:hypothetical protein